MKLYRFLRPIYLDKIDFAINDEVQILKVGDKTYWLTLDSGKDTYITDKQYNELISKQFIILL